MLMKRELTRESVEDAEVLASQGILKFVNVNVFYYFVNEFIRQILELSSGHVRGHTALAPVRDTGGSLGRNLSRRPSLKSNLVQESKL